MSRAWPLALFLAIIAFYLVLLAAEGSEAQEAPICLSAAEKLKDKPETWRGTKKNDSVTGLRGDDKLFGGGGNDFINGGRDDDEVNGGRGSGILCGGRGNDRILGSGGDDLMYGEEENDWIDGGTGNDRILGSAEADDLYGGEGDDIVAGGGGLANDNIDGGAGEDLCVAGEDDVLSACEAVVSDPKGSDSDERPHSVGDGEGGAPTRTSLLLGAGGAAGRVSSEDPACESGRHVRFNTYELGFISVRLDETTSGPDGGWSVALPLFSGLYFAQVDSAPGCRYAVSETLPFEGYASFVL